MSYVIILQASLLADASQNDDESMMSQASTLISRVNVSSTSHKQVLTAAVRMAMITRTKTSNRGSDDRESSVSHPSAHDNKILSSDDHDTSAVTVENKIEVDDVTAADDDSEIDKKADDVTTDDDNEIAENVDDITTDDDSEVAENPNDDTIGLTLPQNASSPSEKDSESSDDSSTDDE